MEALAILFWLAVLSADIVFMRNIKRFADRLFLDEKRPGCAGTQARGCHKMTDVVYQMTKEDVKGD